MDEDGDTSDTSDSAPEEHGFEAERRRLEAQLIAYDDEDVADVAEEATAHLVRMAAAPRAADSVERSILWQVDQLVSGGLRPPIPPLPPLAGGGGGGGGGGGWRAEPPPGSSLLGYDADMLQIMERLHRIELCVMCGVEYTELENYALECRMRHYMDKQWYAPVVSRRRRATLSRIRACHTSDRTPWWRRELNEYQQIMPLYVWKHLSIDGACYVPSRARFSADLAEARARAARAVHAPERADAQSIFPPAPISTNVYIMRFDWYEFARTSALYSGVRTGWDGELVVRNSSTGRIATLTRAVSERDRLPTARAPWTPPAAGPHGAYIRTRYERSHSK